ncbi:MAG: LemA family protein [Nevskiales bacterium]
MLWGISALALALLLYGIWLYNRLVHDRNTVLAAWSDIEVQLKRRHDLIPKLVDAVKAYAGYEQATLTQVTELRHAAEASRQPGESARAEGLLGRALEGLFALAENYPDLKASHQFLDLQNEISTVEQDIQYARRYYNGAVKALNVRVESFPSNIVAGLFRFRQADYFDWPET